MKNLFAFIVCFVLVTIFSYTPPGEISAQLPDTVKSDTLVAQKAITNNYVSVLQFRKLNDSAEMSLDSSATKTQKQMSAMYSLTKSLFNYMKKKETVKVVYIDAATGAVVDPKKFKPKQDIDTRINYRINPIEDIEEPTTPPPVEEIKKPSRIGKIFRAIASLFK